MKKHWVRRLSYPPNFVDGKINEQEALLIQIKIQETQLRKLKKMYASNEAYILKQLGMYSQKEIQAAMGKQKYI